MENPAWIPWEGGIIVVACTMLRARTLFSLHILGQQYYCWPGVYKRKSSYSHCSKNRPPWKTRLESRGGFSRLLYNFQDFRVYIAGEQ